jgi:hypothetical protein
MTLERELLRPIEQLTVRSVVVAAICCAVAIIVQSPARNSAPEGVGRRRMHLPSRTIDPTTGCGRFR